MNAGGVLVVGYGNELRGDDAVGPRVAELLAAGGHLPGARIEARHQLTPELAEDIAASRLVVLVDAVRDGAPGHVCVSKIVGRGQPLGSHAIDPAELVDLAQRIYGHTPPVVLVSVGVEQFEVGAALSPAVASTLPCVIGTVVAVVSDCVRQSTRGT